MLDGLLKVCSAAALIGFLPSVALAAREGVWLVVGGDCLALVLVAALAFIPGIPYIAKLSAVSAVAYLLGLTLLFLTGPFGAGHLYIFAFVILMALFGSIRAMVGANVLLVATYVAYSLASLGHLVSWVQTPVSVVVISANSVFICLVLSFAAHFLIRDYSATARTEQNLRRMLEILLNELEHRVKNNLQIVSSIVTMRARSALNSEQVVEDIKESLAAISAVQQLLYREGSFYLVRAEDLLDSLVKRFRGIYRHIAFSYAWHGEAIDIDSDRAVNLGILINEIVMNSVKHAFDPGSPGTVYVIVHHDVASKSMIMEIGDNGRGMDEPQPKSDGSGLKIIRALTAFLDAEVTITLVGGVRYEFRMRIAEPQSALAGRPTVA